MEGAENEKPSKMLMQDLFSNQQQVEALIQKLDKLLV